MGASGSYTAKAAINPNLFTFTKWGKREIEEFKIRGTRDLADTFALRRSEFDFLLGKSMVGMKQLKALFEEVYDTNENKVVDKYELLCSICLLSKLSNTEKIQFLFDIFNFNNKGYLLPPEISLLLLSVTAGASKADPKFIPPSHTVIGSLVAQALTFAVADPNKSLRKPELVAFTASVVDVNAYLEAWTGYAGQVLLRKGLKWRDLTFPASGLSIAPHNLWLTRGLPPADFVRWVRLSNVQPGAGCTQLFTHVTSFLKTVDRQSLFEGAGAVAGGTFKQGLLADRWILNALASCIARPYLIESLFSLTGQETEGRYCMRVYEGFSWRTIFIDDRIPCSLLNYPLFSRSSDPEESWPILVEKGMAKYLGSFGHLASAGSRSDAHLVAMRLLTGGHTYKMHVNQLDWQSVRDDSYLEVSADGSQALPKGDGAQLVLSLLREGSLVSFGVSELCALDRDYMHSRPVDNNSLPYGPFGYHFAVVGHKEIHGYIYLIIRDAWGLVVTNPAMEQGGLKADHKTGHCRIYSVKIEDIAQHFDTLLICRFPDSLRDRAASLHLKPWRTSVAGRPSFSPKLPAHFKIKVVGNIKEKATAKASDKRGRSKDKDKKQTKGGKSPTRGAASKESDVEEIDATAPVDIAFTFSSACEWIVSGAESAGAKIRVRIVRSLGSAVAPKKTTGRRRKKASNSFDAKSDDAGSAAASNLSAGDGVKSAVHMADSKGGDGSQSLPAAKSVDLDASYLSSDNEGNTSGYDSESKGVKPTPLVYEFSAPRSWMSFSLQLTPGDYHVFANVEFDADPEVLLRQMQVDLPEDIHSMPAERKKVDPLTAHLVDDSKKETPINKVLMQTSSVGVLDVRAVMSDESIASRIKKGNLEDIRVRADRWPFYLESQYDRASSGLVNMLAQLQDEAESQAIRFISATKKFKSLDKRVEFVLEEAQNKEEEEDY